MSDRPDNDSNTTRPTRIACSVCDGERITFVLAKLKLASGYGSDWYRIAIACEGCNGRGYFEGRPVDA